MLTFAAGLDSAGLAAVADLERRVVAADGGRLKLEWGTLRSRSGERPEELLWWQDGELAGFAGLYSFGAPAVELAGMVDPRWRRRGIGTALLRAARSLCRGRGYDPVLLVTPHNGAGGSQFALRHGGVLDHIEYVLELTGPPAPAPEDPRTTVRPADVTRDGPDLEALLLSGFGWRRPPGEPLNLRESTLVVERDEEVAGTLRVTRDAEGQAGVYGFVIRADLRGQGIGRDVLRRVCLRARAGGAHRIRLEVAAGNDRALHLYRSVGFVRLSADEYYSLPAG